MSLTPEMLQSYYDVDEKGRYRIETRLSTHDAVFDDLDPAPIERRALDAAIGQYILSSVEELPLPAPVVLEFHVETHATDHEEDAEARTVRGIRNYFLFQYRLAAEKVTAAKRRAAITAAVAVLFVVVSLLVAGLMERNSASGTLAGTLRELLTTGLTVCTWVFLWEAVSIVAFRLPEVRRQLIQLRKVLEAEVCFSYHGRGA
ncbi:MAG: hypothetical protein ACYDHF_08995 [Candidatus Cryosericum sp.]